jgi:hypothetical protein
MSGKITISKPLYCVFDILAPAMVANPFSE